jgi:hypothetical protein
VRGAIGCDMASLDLFVYHPISLFVELPECEPLA